MAWELHGIGWLGETSPADHHPSLFGNPRCTANRPPVVAAVATSAAAATTTISTLETGTPIPQNATWIVVDGCGLAGWAALHRPNQSCGTDGTRKAEQVPRSAL